MTALYTPATGARTAASLLLLRDGSVGLEVLMLRRAEREADARSGVTVFPGGVLDARDAEARPHALGPDDASASALLGVQADGLDYLIAAVRETFEEVGLLLVDGPALVPDALAALAPWRDRLQDGSASAADFCRATGLRLDLRGLVYFSHWLTPPGVPKRFDTRFFMALAPAGQQAQADLGEAVELMWLSPHEALAAERGLKLLPVTQRTLQQLAQLAAQHGNAAAVLQATRAALVLSAPPLIMPRRAVSAGGPRVVMPDEWPYAEIGRLDPLGRGDVHADLQPGRAVRLSPHVLRVTAPNPGPMTGPGTNSYLVGADDAWTVIDPGPASAEHTAALLAAAPGRIVQILVTHTHRDHSPGATALAAATGAPVLGRVAAHPEWQDDRFQPQRQLQHGERLSLAPGVTLDVIHTPGHASNHLCYRLEEEKLLFTGDHVMQGSTVVINPPDGDMSAYLQSLQALLAVDLDWLAPGHGFLVDRPHAVLRGLIAHRLKREAKVRAALRATPEPLALLVARVYDDVQPALHGVAQRSLLAHLLKLHADGLAREAPEGWSAA